MPVVDPAVAALAFPAVMLSLMGLFFTVAAVRGRDALDAMSRRGSALYLGILVVYTIAAVILTRPTAEQLGLVPDGDAAGWALRTAAFTVIGVVAAWGLLLAELELALRLGRGRGGLRPPAPARSGRAPQPRDACSRRRRSHSRSPRRCSGAASVCARSRSSTRPAPRRS